MEWRNARASDLATLMAWVGNIRECRLWAGGKVRFPLQATQLAEDIEFAPENAWCLCENGELVGFGQILQRAPARAHLARLIVAPALRGHGYGAALCGKLLETATRWPDYEIATLNVFRANLAAQALYTRMGFYAVDLAESEQRDPNVLLMVRALRDDDEPTPARRLDGPMRRLQP